jgi:hypothetical protein
MVLDYTQEMSVDARTLKDIINIYLYLEDILKK